MTRFGPTPVKRTDRGYASNSEKYALDRLHSYEVDSFKLIRTRTFDSHAHSRSKPLRDLIFTWPSRRFLQYRLVPIHRDVITDLLLSLPKLLLKLDQFRQFLIFREVPLTKIA